MSYMLQYSNIDLLCLYLFEVLFGWVDLLVSFGGIAGLFLGFSLLSGVEIIYYFTLRTCCMMHKNRVGGAFKTVICKSHYSLSNITHVSHE